MEYRIKLKTSGTHLSMNTLNSVTSDIKKLIELSLFDALCDEFPDTSKTTIKKLLIKYPAVELELDDAKKGSWELILVGATGGAIGGLVSRLAADLIIDTDNYRNFKNKIHSISHNVTKYAKNRLSNRDHYGILEVKKRHINVNETKQGASQLELDVILSRKISQQKAQVTMEEQIDQLINNLENKDNN